MPVYRDERDPSKWVCKVNYKDYTGKSTQKKKRGFKTKKEAQDYIDKYNLAIWISNISFREARKYSLYRLREVYEILKR